MNKIPLFTLIKHPICFSFRQFLTIFVVACLMGGVTNYPFIVKSLGGGLLSEIQKKQLADLKAKAKQLSPHIRFVDLVSAKKLFDEGAAIFLDARSADERAEGTIKGAIGVSVMSVVTKKVDLEGVIPDKNSLVVTFCSGGECDVAVEMAKELVDRHYTNVYVLAEGYPGWLRSDFPVVISRKKGAS
jgi:rhodanese-related sulfurtransferase